MKKGMDAHLRRNLSTLKWLANEKSEAIARWRSFEPNTWKDLKPVWRTSRGRIWLEFEEEGVRRSFRLSSIHPGAHGVHIFLESRNRSIPERLEVLWRVSGMDGLSTSPRMQEMVLSWVRRRFPSCRVVSITQGSEKARSLSGSFVRLVLLRGNNLHLVLVSDATCTARTVPSIITQAILWLRYVETRWKHRKLSRIYLLVPRASSAKILHRMRFLNGERLKFQVWTRHPEKPSEWELRRKSSRSAFRENRDYSWPVMGPFRWSPLLARVVDLAPVAIRRHPRLHRYDTLRLHGLEFARVYGQERDRIFYGVGEQKTELTKDRFGDLRALVEEILFYRRPDSSNSRHPFFRLQSERWLESLILEDAARIFPELAPGAVYSQIPVYFTEDAGRVDVLGADDGGRLVVMELKTAEDPDLPLQSIDYWGRVIAHNKNGDFQRRGYFPGVRITRDPPRIYLVAPVFSFHDSNERIFRFLHPTLELWRISVNEDWRCGVRVMRRIRVRCGDLP